VPAGALGAGSDYDMKLERGATSATKGVRPNPLGGNGTPGESEGGGSEDRVTAKPSGGHTKGTAGPEKEETGRGREENAIKQRER